MNISALNSHNADHCCVDKRNASVCIAASASDMQVELKIYFS
jgi:hypothetical protein